MATQNQRTKTNKADKRSERARRSGVYPGARFGYLTVIQRVSLKGAQNSRWRVECDCGKRESVPAFYLLRPKWPKRSCGCITYADANPFPRERGIWWMMHRRCYHEDHVGYPYYGAKGVIVCPEWHRDNPQGWTNFIAFMGAAPTKDHSLDRVDPRGNYQPFQADGKTRQVRWATSEQQGANKRSDWDGKPPT